MSSVPANTLYITFIVALGGFVFGFDASVIAGTVNFITETFSLTHWQQGIVVSAPTLGALIAMFFAGVISDRYGRKQTLLCVSLLYVVSAIFSALATSFEMLLIARFVGGLAFCSLMIAPMYIAEISAATHRGKLVSINQFNIVLGLSASYFTNYGLLTISQSDSSWVRVLMLDTQTWRWMLALEIVPALVWFRVNVRIAIGCAAFSGLIIAIFGTASFIIAGWNATDVPEHSIGYVYLPATLGIVVTSVFAANIGAKLGQKVNVRILKMMLACLLVLVSIRMILGIE